MSEKQAVESDATPDAASMAELTAANTATPAPALPPVKLSILIMLIGTRGDLQPALEIGSLLRRRHGHRVRVATHPPHRPAVLAAGLEFASVGSLTDVREMQRRRMLSWEEMKPLVPRIKAEFDEMGRRWWEACLGGGGAGGGGGGHGDGGEGTTGEGLAGHEDDFVADAIIATMQCFVQTSAAARMGIPLHMLGTNVRTPTKYLPHSQAVDSARETSRPKNRFSFWLFDYL